MAHPTDAEQNTWKLGRCMGPCLGLASGPGLNLALAALAGLALALAAPAALAQDGDGGGEEELAEEIEEIVVVGSRISRVYTAGGAPISVFDRRDIIASGTASVGDFLQQLPGQGSAVNTTYNNGGDGSVRVGFRNLQPPRTLVLVNGRRWVNSGTGADSSVDLNTIPIVMIERIEVLKDGASAVYGSDAIAAVVNVITRDSIDGLHFGFRDGEYTAGGGRIQTYEMTFGGRSDDGNTTFIIGASIDREYELSNADRVQTAAPPVGGSSGTPQGSFSYSNPVDDLQDEASKRTRRFLTTTTVSTFRAAGDPSDDPVPTADAKLGDAVAARISGTEDFVELQFQQIEGTWYDRQRHIYTPAVTDSTPTPTERITLHAAWLALTPQQQYDYSQRGDYRKEYRFSDNEWYEFGQTVTLTNDDDPGMGGTITETVTRPVQGVTQPLATQFEGGAEETNAFGDTILPCTTFTAKDGGGVDSTLGENGERLLYTEGSNVDNFRCWESGRDRFNYNPQNLVRTPNERRSVFAILGRDIYEGHRAKVEISYQNRRSNQKLAPQPLFWGLRPGQHIAHDNVYNPFGVQFCAGGDMGTNNCAHPDDLDSGTGELIDSPTKTVWGRFGRRLLEFSNRFFRQDIETFRFAASLEGSIDANWDYTAFWQWAQNQSVVSGQGELNTSFVQNALGSPSGCTGRCVPLNVFGGQGANARRDTPLEQTGPGGTTWSGSGSITPEMVEYLSFTRQDTGANTLKAYGFEVSGNVGSLPGGPIGIAAGLEIRGETGYSQPDAIVAAGITSGGAAKPTSGGYDVTSLFAEGAFPWITSGDLSFETLMALRYSDYSTFGSNLTYKLTNRFALGEAVVLRSTISTGFRAPSIANLFGGEEDNFPAVEDPCAVNSANFTGDPATGVQDTRCNVAGVPNGFMQVDTQIRTTDTANFALEPEESNNLTLGVVIKPAGNLEVSFDYFDVEITNTITRVSAQLIFNGCYGVTQVLGADFFCTLITRDATGAVSDIRNAQTNLSVLKTSGIDGTVLWRDIETPFGTWDLSFDIYLMREFTTTLGDGVTSGDLKGYVLGSGRSNYADQRFRMFVDWRYGAWDARLILQGIGAATGVEGFPPSSSETQRPLSATQYLDGHLAYTFTDMMGYGKDLRLTFGFSNLLDQDPPYFPESFGNNHNPDYRTWGSQAYYLRVSGNF